MKKIIRYKEEELRQKYPFLKHTKIMDRHPEGDVTDGTLDFRKYNDEDSNSFFIIVWSTDKKIFEFIAFDSLEDAKYYFKTSVEEGLF